MSALAPALLYPTQHCPALKLTPATTACFPLYSLGGGARRRPAAQPESCWSCTCASISGIAAITVLGIVSAVLGQVATTHTSSRIRVDVFSEPLCAGLGKLAATSIEGLATGRGTADIVDLRYHPLGHCAVASSHGVYRCSCPSRPHPEAECTLARFAACVMGHKDGPSPADGWAHAHNYWPFVRCLERLANSEVNRTVSTGDAERYAEVCAQATQAWRPGGSDALLASCADEQQWYKWLLADAKNASRHLDPASAAKATPGSMLPSDMLTPAIMVEGEALSLVAATTNTLDPVVSKVCFKWGTASLPDGCNNRLKAANYSASMCV